jgi:hypothetical protein
VPVGEVTELLRRWREAGGVWSRGRVLTDAARLVARLTPEERRVLAQALADHGAPELARHLEDRSGHAIDPRQVQAFADGLLDLDRARLDELIGALDDPAERHRLAQVALAQTAPPAAVEPERDAAAPPPPPQRQPRLAGSAQVAEPTDVPIDEVVAAGGLDVEDIAAARLADQELGEIQLGGQDLGEVELGWQELGTAELGEQRLGEATLGGTPHADLDREVSGSEPDLDDRPPALPEAPVESTDAPAHDRATGDHHGGRVDTSEPAGSDERPVERLVATLRDCRTAAARSAVLASGDLAALGADEALRVLDAVPSGWQRRRAARRLLDAGALAGVGPAELLERFPGNADRRFVAGYLLAVDGRDPDELAGLLPHPVVARLAARQER